MLLDIVKLIRPVSIGPGIMGGQGTDGIPLQRGINTARADGATVVWCHSDFGFEDVTNWLAGLLHAQNIFDGDLRVTYANSFYRFLNLGMQVPFSTGTDWFIYDFSRVYVPVDGPLTAKKWLAQLKAGKSYITNGTFLEFSVNDRPIGDTIALSGPRELAVRGRAVGRNDFGRLELVLNGEVIRMIDSKLQDDRFAAQQVWTVNVDQPGWLCLRIPPTERKNEFGKRLFAHTSPIYLEMAGQRLFQRDIAEQLIVEMEGNIKVINDKGKFADEAERDAVLRVHRRGIEILRQRLNE